MPGGALEAENGSKSTGKRKRKGCGILRLPLEAKSVVHVYVWTCYDMLRWTRINRGQNPFSGCKIYFQHVKSYTHINLSILILLTRFNF